MPIPTSLNVRTCECCGGYVGGGYSRYLGTTKLPAGGKLYFYNCRQCDTTSAVAVDEYGEPMELTGEEDYYE